MSDQPKVQNRNADMVDLLRTDFVDRNEPNYAWRAACSAVLALPALRAFWPMSSVDYTTASRARDIAGGGYHLSDNNTVTFGYDQLMPYAQFTAASTQYLSRADGGAANWADIIGTETYVIAAQRGLTFGGWFYLDSLTATQVFISKFGAGADRSYELVYVLGTNSFTLFLNNVAVTTASSVTPATGQWYLIIGRFVPGATGDIYVNGTKDTTVTAVAVLTDSTIPLAIGARSVPAFYLDGRASLCFLCAAALSDSIIGALYHNTRKAFNV